MPAEVLISCDNVGKKFCRDLKKSLWYGVTDAMRDLTQNSSQHFQQLREGEFWANHGISFELKRGECLGLIGQNGAGKTTLLKILNGLIKPDQGHVEMRGKIGALIALGAGFNPLLSGRENIYVNGTVLGIARSLIDAKFDEIVEFAELASYIDMPTRSYSSGMLVRLGFSTAVNLINPDILILDEVLAVGDLSFRAKCYATISERMSQSACILVSHSTNDISRVTTRALLLRQGEVAVDSTDVSAVLDEYSSTDQRGSIANFIHRDPNVHFVSCSINGQVIKANSNESQAVELESNCRTHINISFQSHSAVGTIRPRIIFIQSGTSVAETTSLTAHRPHLTHSDSRLTNILVDVPHLPLKPGRYSVRFLVDDKRGACLFCLEWTGALIIRGHHTTSSMVLIPSQYSVST